MGDLLQSGRMEVGLDQERSSPIIKGGKTFNDGSRRGGPWNAINPFDEVVTRSRKNNKRRGEDRYCSTSGAKVVGGRKGKRVLQRLISFSK